MFELRLKVVVVVGVALLPYALYVLFARGFLQSVATAVASLLATLVPLVLVDRLFYGRWTVSIPSHPSNCGRNVTMHRVIWQPEKLSTHALVCLQSAG